VIATLLDILEPSTPDDDNVELLWPEEARA
jgi:hypothetical protein